MKKTIEKEKNLTNKQKEVLKYIKQFSAKNKYPCQTFSAFLAKVLSSLLSRVDE